MGLVLLGLLTKLQWVGGEKRWGLRTAPLLAYDREGRLHIVSGRTPRGASSSAARSSYAETHWGNRALGALVEGRELRPPFAAGERLGAGTSIVYTAAKAGPELVDYEHAWGARAPVVVRAHGLYALEGGSYRVTGRGIVG